MMAILIISSCLFSFIVGCITATHIYSKRNVTVLRLKNIHEVAQNLFDGKYGDDEFTAISFILCESDLSLRSLRREKK